MGKVAIGLLLGAVLALAGCASVPDARPAGPQAAASHAMDDDTPVTGTRLVKRKSTDRMLKTVGAQDARDAMDSTPDPLKSE